MKSNNKSSLCLDNLRTLRECIQSCFSCDEGRCQHMKERFEHHAISHHSSGQAIVNQDDDPSAQNLASQVRRISSLKRQPSVSLSNEQTSTRDLVFQNMSKQNEMYNDVLRKEILEWSENLPVYQNEKFEDLKQNLINEFVEEIYKLRLNADTNEYDSKLLAVIENFIDPLPTYTEAQGSEESKNNLKENLYNIINKININQLNRITKNTFVDSKLNNNQINRLSYREISTNGKNDSHLNVKPYLSDTSTSTTQVFNERYITNVSNITNNPYQTMATAVDAETQDSFYARPYFNEVYGFQPKLMEVHKNNKNDELCKREIHKQFKQMFDKNNLSSFRRESLVDHLLSRVKLLCKNNLKNTLKIKTAIKAEIYKFFDDFSLEPLINENNINNLVEDIPNRLLFEKPMDLRYNIHYSNLNNHKNCNLRSLIYQIVYDKLSEVNIFERDTITKIVNKIVNNVTQSDFNYSPDLRNELFKIINDSSDLCDITIVTIINFILKQIQCYKSTNIVMKHVDDEIENPYLPRSLYIYKSEDKLQEPHHSNVRNEPYKTNGLICSSDNLISKEKSYLEKLSNIINTWIINISNKLKKPNSKEVKDIDINILANDLLDQKKIEQYDPETSVEKRKYMNFLILRWLIKFEYFADLKHAKPYVNTLIEEIDRVDTPIFVKTEPPNLLHVQKRTSKIHLDEKKVSTSELYQTKNLVPNHPNACCYKSLPSDSPLGSRTDSTLDSIKVRSNDLVAQDKSYNTTKELIDKIVKNLHQIENEINKIQSDESPYYISLNSSNHSTNSMNQNQLIDSSKNIRNNNTPPISPICCPKKSAELIIDIVKCWCQQLPLSEMVKDRKEITNAIKNNLIIQIVTKINELNMNPETFNDDPLFDILLDKEIENIFNKLPASNELLQSKNNKKWQLINAIKSVKPIIKLQNALCEYKQKIKNTISLVMDNPNNQNIGQMPIYKDLRDKIIDHYIMYNRSKDDRVRQNFHKKNICDCIVTYYQNIRGNENKLQKTDPKCIFNQLLWELNKVPAPNIKSIKEDVKEMRIKLVIHELFDELQWYHPMKNQIEYSLVKRLSDVEKEGHTKENENRMKQEIIRTLEKFGTIIDDERIDKIMKELEITETSRKMYFPEDYKEFYVNAELMQKPLINYQHNKDTDEESLSYQNKTISGKDQCISTPPSNPLQSKLNYETFERNIHLSSTILRNTTPKYNGTTSDSAKFSRSHNLEKTYDDLRRENITRPPINFPKIDEDKWYSLPLASSNEHDSNKQNDLQDNTIINVRQQPHSHINSYNFNQSQIKESFKRLPEAKGKDESLGKGSFSKAEERQGIWKGHLPSNSIASSKSLGNEIQKDVLSSNQMRNQQSPKVHQPKLNIIKENIHDSDQSQTLPINNHKSQSLVVGSEVRSAMGKNGDSPTDPELGQSQISNIQKSSSYIVEPETYSDIKNKDSCDFNQIQNKQPFEFSQAKLGNINDNLQKHTPNFELKQNQQSLRWQKAYQEDANEELDHDTSRQKVKRKSKQPRYNRTSYAGGNRSGNSDFNIRDPQQASKSQHSAEEIESHGQNNECDSMPKILKNHIGSADQDEIKNISNPNLRDTKQESGHQLLSHNVLETGSNQCMNLIPLKCRSSQPEPSICPSLRECNRTTLAKSRNILERENNLAGPISPQANLCQRRIVTKKCEKSCRRPSIAILTPGRSCDPSRSIRILETKETDDENNYNEGCICKRQKNKATLPSYPLQTPLCKICGGSQPFCCDISRNRYPGYYYY